jgi:trimeric autotransporter adhesin
VAGYGSYGSTGDGGPAVSAGLSSPDDVAVDTSGNIYIADSGNNRIRMVTKSTGIVATVAGTGSAGYSGDGGPATSATLSYPRGITLDGSGNMYIADTYNHRIRIVSKGSGIINTVAGIGIAGYGGDGFQASSALLYNPRTVAVDASRNIYVADSGNNRIRLVMRSTGIITTVAGTGSSGSSGDGKLAVSATLNYPYSVAVDASGNLFIADTYNHRIRMVTSTGIITTIAGTGSVGSAGDGGPAALATVNYPCDVTLDASGNLYIADTDNYRIRLVTKSSGVISAVAGAGTYGSTGDGGQAVLATFYNPHGVAVDSAGNVYIADSGNNRIRMFMLPKVSSKASAPFKMATSALF